MMANTSLKKVFDDGEDILEEVFDDDEDIFREVLLMIKTSSKNFLIMVRISLKKFLMTVKTSLKKFLMMVKTLGVMIQLNIDNIFCIKSYLVTRLVIKSQFCLCYCYHSDHFCVLINLEAEYNKIVAIDISCNICNISLEKAFKKWSTIRKLVLTRCCNYYTGISQVQFNVQIIIELVYYYSSALCILCIKCQDQRSNRIGATAGSDQDKFIPNSNFQL